MHLRHDLAPYTQIPDPAAGDLGIDHLTLTNATLDAPPGGRPALRPVELAPPSPNPSRGPVP